MLCVESFALAIVSIKEIIGYGSLTEVPLTPGFMRGVINLRGGVVPVEDEARQNIGLMVDSLCEVLKIPLRPGCMD